MAICLLASMACGVKAGNNRPARDDDDKQGGFHRTPVTLLENLRVDLKKEDGRYEIEPGDIAVPSAARVRLDVQLGGTSVKEGVGPIVLFFDGEHIWTANSMDGTVAKLSLDGEVVATYPVGAAPAKNTFSKW